MENQNYKENYISEEVQEKEDTNEVIVQGRIVKKVERPYIVVLTISTGWATNEPSYVKVHCFGKCRELAATYKQHDYVMVKGHIQSYAKKPEIKHQLTLLVSADEVLPPESAFSNSIGKTYYEGKNSFSVSGRIVNVKASENSNSVYLVIRSLKNGHPSYVRATYYPYNVSKAMSELKKNRYAYFHGYVSGSTTPDKNGVYSHNQYYIINEVHAI